jgi:hypothetical protein
VDASLALLLLAVLAIASASGGYVVVVVRLPVHSITLLGLFCACVHQSIACVLARCNMSIYSTLLSLLVQLNACYLQLLTIPGEFLMLLLVCACSKWSNGHHVLVVYLLAQSCAFYLLSYATAYACVYL